MLEGDHKAVAAAGERGLMELMAVTHTGNTTEEFEKIVRDWIASAKHPPNSTGLYTDMVYQPMLELLAYLRANGFKTFIVSGGGIEFMRPWVERVYGIPPEQVVGSRAKVKYAGARRRAGLVPFARDRPHRRRSRETSRHPSGHRPPSRPPRSATQTATSRCSSGRRRPPASRFGFIVHHTDAEREYAYDRKSRIRHNLTRRWTKQKLAVGQS